MKQRLIDATDLVSRVLRVRNKTLTDPVPGFGYAACNADRFKQAMHGGIRKALREIETSPTIDAEPVRHGRWMPAELHKSFGMIFGVKCSLCGDEKVTRYNYCPNCGAKMTRRTSEVG